MCSRKPFGGIMEFNSKWITTREFAPLDTINVFRKEHAPVSPDGKKTPDELLNNHCIFSRKFAAHSGENYFVRISADDYYKLYVNGHFVCQGPSEGYHDEYYYNEADITPFIVSGDNVIAAHVYYQGLINRVWNSGDNRQGMIADVYCGDLFAFGTDESWRYFYAREYVSGGKIGYDTQFLENIDFNLAVSGALLGGGDGSECAAVVREDDDHRFVAKADTVSVYSLKPTEIVEISTTHIFADFGKEYTGQIRLTAHGKKGEKVIIRLGEELEGGEQYKVRYNMRCNCKYEEVCTLSGGEDVFDFYDYKCFRYAEIISETECVDKSSVEFVVRHHKFDVNAATFCSNNDVLNRIWQMCAHGVMLGTQEVFVDCPSREKGQYLGDFCVTGLSYMYLTGDWRMYRKTLLEFAHSCRVCKGMMAVAPGAFMQEIADFSLLYPHAVGNYLNYSGDEETVRKLMPTIDGIIGYFGKYRRADGLLEGVDEKWNLVDWPDNLRDNYDFELTNPPKSGGCHNVINAYYCGALRTAEDLKKRLGIAFEPTADAVAESYVKEFFDADRGLFTDTARSTHSSLHSNVLALCFGMAPESAHENIKRLIMSKGMCCGVWFAYFVLKALASIGAYDKELALILDKSEHSWYNMLREGATSCYEAWGKEQKFNTSLCHPWASSPIIALVEDIVGSGDISSASEGVHYENDGLKIFLKIAERQ